MLILQRAEMLKTIGFFALIKRFLTLKGKLRSDLCVLAAPHLQTKDLL